MDSFSEAISWNRSRWKNTRGSLELNIAAAQNGNRQSQFELDGIAEVKK